MKDNSKLVEIFKTTFLSSMTANSGYAILSVLKNTCVEKNHWFTEDQMTDYIALAQSTPGPMGINGSMIIGYELAGMPGALVAALGCTLPPLVIMSLVTYFYEYFIDNKYLQLFMAGMQYGVVAMLIDVMIGMFRNVTKKDKVYTIVAMILAFVYVRYIKKSLFYLAVAFVIAGCVKTLVIKKKVEEREDAVA